MTHDSRSFSSHDKFDLFKYSDKAHVADTSLSLYSVFVADHQSESLAAIIIDLIVISLIVQFTAITSIEFIFWT